MQMFLIASACSLAIAFFSWRLRLLTSGGAMAAFGLGACVFSLGWAWTVPLLVFFCASSLISKFTPRRKQPADEIAEKGSRRDARQVLANGGVAWAASIGFLLNPQEIWYAAYLASLAAAAADTWATELGSLSLRPPRRITDLRVVPAGTSGGVTGMGLSASLAGAAAVTVSGLVLTEMRSPDIAVATGLIAGLGFIGSLIDSLLGATLQSRRTCAVCGRATEKKSHCGEATQRTGGLHWLDNDGVNFLTTLSTGIAGGFGSYLL